MDYLEINDLIDSLRANIAQYLDIASQDDLDDLIEETIETL